MKFPSLTYLLAPAVALLFGLTAATAHAATITSTVASMSGMGDTKDVVGGTEEFRLRVLD